MRTFSSSTVSLAGKGLGPFDLTNSHSSTLGSLHPFCFCPGIEAKLDNINQLKVKGLVLGPLHTVQADQPSTLDLQEIDPEQGTKEELRSVLDKAHRKGRSSDNIS